MAVPAYKLQGIADPALYRRLREEYAPVDEVGYNWLVYDLDRPRFPAGVVESLAGGAGWQASADVDAAASAAPLPPAPLAERYEGFVPALEYPGTDARLMACPPGAAGCVFRRDLQLSAPPAQAFLHLASRDTWRLEVNGATLATGSCARTYRKSWHRLEARLRAGANLVLLRAWGCSRAAPAPVLVELRVVRRP